MSTLTIVLCTQCFSYNNSLTLQHSRKKPLDDLEIGGYIYIYIYLIIAPIGRTI